MLTAAPGPRLHSVACPASVRNGWTATSACMLDSLVQEIESLKDNNEAWSLDVQDKWRYVVIAGGLPRA